MNACSNPEILKVIYFFNLLIDIVKIVVPIGIIVFGLIDFSKAVISGEEKENKKTVNLFVKRLMYGILIFAIPWIIEVVMVTLGDLIDKDNMGNFTDCLENANSECIEALDSKNISTIKSICDVPENFTIEEDTPNQGNNQNTNEFCWQCNDNPNIYQWGKSATSDSNCHAGWHQMNKTKEECQIANNKTKEVCWQCNDNPNLYQWGESTASDPNCHAGWHQINKTKEECPALHVKD